MLSLFERFLAGNSAFRIHDKNVSEVRNKHILTAIIILTLKMYLLLFCVINLTSHLNSFQINFHFYTYWKQHPGFLMFSGGIEREHYPAMGK